MNVMKKRFRNLAFFTLVLLLTALAASAQIKVTPITGTKASLTPPAGFAPSEQFPGFIHETSGASIMVTEMPAPYSKIVEAFTKEELATKGMTLISRRPHTVSGKAGVLVHLRQVVQGTAYLKWMAATGTEKETVLITATFPEQFKLKWSAALEKAVANAQWNESAEVDQLAGLNFAIKDHPEMKIARRITNLLLLTSDGMIPGKPTNDAMLIVGSAVANVAIDDLKQFAADRLREITQIKGATIKQQNAVTLAGMPGSEIIAEAEWQNPTAPATVFQIILRSENSYFIMQGFAPRAEQEKYLKIFRGIAQSFEKK
jgi:hypothetical protein